VLRDRRVRVPQILFSLSSGMPPFAWLAARGGGHGGARRFLCGSEKRALVGWLGRG